jgi:cytochrome c553
VSCHGPSKQKAGLRLDTADGFQKGGESGALLVAGDPAKSRIVEAITYHNSELQMPPKGKLVDRDIQAISEWVKTGARWPAEKNSAADTSLAKGKQFSEADRKFWSLQPIRRGEPPTLGDQKWASGPIDRFLLAAMQKRGLTPNSKASKETLIRRAAFDLTGLPPSPGDIKAFVDDQSPDAYPKLIEKLLNSPAYGERWARHWLDLVRYGEDQAHTFEARVFPQGYLYRDWVAKALNQDMPYDRFLMLQIAGDLIAGPESEKEDRLAALGLLGLGACYYSGSPTAISDERDDKIDTLCRTALALTVSCARCHDHKFDPISTVDYYGLASIMASTVYKEYPKASQAEVAKYDEAQAKIKSKTTEIAAYIRSEASKVPEKLVVQETTKYVVASWTLANMRKADAKVTSASVAAKQGLKGDILERWHAYLYDLKSNVSRPYLAKWQKLVEKEDAKQDLSSQKEKRAQVEQIALGLQDYLKATLSLRDAIKTYDTAEKANSVSEPGNDRPKLRDVDTRALKEIASTDGVFAIPLNGGRAEPYLDPAVRLVLKAKRAELELVKKASPPKYSVIHAVADAPSPTTLKVHLRGNPATLGEDAPRRFLGVLSEKSSKSFEGSGRLGLAKAIASKDNPLTARVMVNRIWAQHFGRGIVATPSNFGKMGEQPTHPELLDWLATKFIDSGWSQKSIHRLIMLSSAYQQSSDPTTKSMNIDGENLLLSHFNRRRLEVEAWRDAMLSVTGELDSKLGGPSLELASNDNHRRTIYAKVSRHKLDGLLRQFDFPDPNLTSDKRNVSTVPLQGLFVLNSEFMNRRAEALANRLTRDTKQSDESRIQASFLLLFGRSPASDELAMGIEFLHSFPKGSSAGPSAWVQYSQVLLGSNEFMFVD